VSTFLDASAPPFEQSRLAVSSLRYAQESADRGEYADALLWMHVLEATGEPIPAEYQTKRSAWNKHRIANSTDRRPF
jgi:hypothetical protein